LLVKLLQKYLLGIKLNLIEKPLVESDKNITKDRIQVPFKY